MTAEVKREHTYHAEAFTLSGQLELPIIQEIRHQAYLKIPDKGGYLSQQGESYRLGGVISLPLRLHASCGKSRSERGPRLEHAGNFRHRKPERAGRSDGRPCRGAVVHGPPLIGYIPSVTFLGTRFGNLRIAGHPVKLELDPGMLGSKPGNDTPYTGDRDFVQRVVTQHERVCRHQGLSAEVLERFKAGPVILTKDKTGKQESIECSLVNQADGGYPGRSFGHVIDVPNFGKIHLATVRLKQSDYETKTGAPAKTLISLTMIELELGCIGKGKAAIGGAEVNGNTKP